MDLIREHRYEYGLNRCCEALALSKGTWHHRMKHEEREDDEEEAVVREEIHSAIDYQASLTYLEQHLWGEDAAAP